MWVHLTVTIGVSCLLMGSGYPSGGAGLNVPFPAPHLISIYPISILHICNPVYLSSPCASTLYSHFLQVMLNRDIPDPKDIRKFDLMGPLGTVNYRCEHDVKV